MSRPLYLFVGQSGSGKTTIVEELENICGRKSIQSYTTRPQRYENEYGHTFISDDEFDKLENIIAYTEYHGFRYCSTEELIDNSDLYVVDPDGVETLLEKYSNTERTICIFYLDTTVTTRVDRMVDRGDSDTSIVSRLRNDEKFDWYYKLSQIVWKHENIMNRDVVLYKINANGKKGEILEQILYYINKLEGAEW